MLGASAPSEIVEKIGLAEPGCAVTVARWENDRLSLAARQAPIPWLLRFGRPVPFEVRESAGVQQVTLETARGDLLVIGSRGLSSLVSEGKPASADKAAQRLARAAETQPLSAAFASLVSEWKKMGVAPGDRDLLLLAAKRL
jgi:hypothetical protein